MKLLCLVALSGAALLSSPPTLGIAGRWAQKSNGKELVLVPRIKLVPNVGVTAGTSLGGTVGYGSMTRTTIVTEPVMMAVARSMTLAIEPNGRFAWTITRRHAEKQGCTITTTQEKHGRVDQTGANLSLAISGGIERFTTSCGRSGETKLGSSTETYTVQKLSNGIALSDGAKRWAFTR
ncbi:hypothetical protein [Sphingomonas sp.]|jgi:hypothetical protein|uniref:hypothetical protein n=1 Tax=Sphingomonas sp. TaxID=28214 RepID=UPI002E144FF2|nr:hypothetical protein [Sphingomonas sp.]